ncbi:lipoate--protein ligase family protein [Cohnella abietis]|uniref:BPL/LPL catalytic domain-containing protein n=1 Tax=Cohnella abietis TaxID=2507935 RepID=A0A3T1DDZ9_9BACL|nr:lipoate--protein ligase family protein [Cohnella abietis]BBI36381.1 hypothetical protein KCTCHS21_57800 [Cohnella abietis]
MNDNDMESEMAWTKDMLLLDRTEDLTGDSSYSFALDELLCRQAGEGGPAVCHLWRHPRAFVMGTKDSRLPRAADAVRWLEHSGYDVLVRHSGGAAVPLDTGVINLSLIMPISATFAQGFRNDFDRMYAFIRQSLASLGCNIHKGEVEGSYCPGDYDLHIDGFKFCGIAQRRQVRSMIVQAFVLVEGSGVERAELVKAFYERAGVGAEPGAYPLIKPTTMSSLQERSVVGNDGVLIFKNAVIETLHELQANQWWPPSENLLSIPQPAIIQDMGNKLRQRYPVPR